MHIYLNSDPENIKNKRKEGSHTLESMNVLTYLYHGELREVKCEVKFGKKSPQVLIIDRLGALPKFWYLYTSVIFYKEIV